MCKFFVTQHPFARESHVRVPLVSLGSLSFKYQDIAIVKKRSPKNFTIKTPKGAVWLFVCSWSYPVSALPFLYSAELQPLAVQVRNFVGICGT